MLRPSLASVHVAPASSLLNNPPLSFSTSAYTRLGLAPDTATQMRPIIPAGRPWLRVISFHVSPPSVLLYNPEPGPPLDMVYSVRKASHSAANITLGLDGSIEMSIAPVLSSL